MDKRGRVVTSVVRLGVLSVLALINGFWITKAKADENCAYCKAKVGGGQTCASSTKGHHGWKGCSIHDGECDLCYYEVGKPPDCNDYCGITGS